MRWWEAGGLTIEDERAAFVAAGLDFALDETAVREHDVVIFRGELRRNERRQSAIVIYPPTYGEGDQVKVYAPEVPLGRHWEEGLICLDHLRAHEDRPLNGAEGVLRAEELWRLVEEDPDELRRQEIDVALPATERYAYLPDALLYVLGADLSEAKEGWLRARTVSQDPLRGQIVGLGDGLRANAQLTFENSFAVLAGSTTVPGAWRRLAAPPPLSPVACIHWLTTEQADLVEYAIALSPARHGINVSNSFVLVAFVFPDEGPSPGEVEDRWLAFVLDVNGGIVGPCRVIAVRASDQFVRQPGMASLAQRRIGLVGAGALGSQIAAALARAGLGQIDLTDPEELASGNVVRHELTLRDVGRDKTRALAVRLASINPWIGGTTSGLRIGSTAGALATPIAQQQHDSWVDGLAAVDLLINATATPVASRWLAKQADSLRIPCIHAAVSAGGWGARVLIQRPGGSGCPECLARHQEDEDGVVPAWSEDPNGHEVMGRGCTQPTFAAPGFEIEAAATAAARIAVQVLLDGDGYPAADFDLATLEFRSEMIARPRVDYTSIPRHSACRTCAP